MSSFRPLTVRVWTKDARKEEKQAMQEKVWQLHLSCLSQRQITDATGTPQQTVGEWVTDFASSSIFGHPPSRTDGQPWGSIQHFDVWSFASNDRAGAVVTLQPVTHSL